MEARQNPYPLRIEKIIMDKFKHIAKENGRSVNKEIEMLLKDAISKYEIEKGIITVVDD